LHSTI
jgi:hypothetical protein